MGACSGIRVVELGSMVTAPLAGQILGDLGAEVIKIEPPEGEIMRSIPPVYKGRSAAFTQWNRNKKSVALDLKQPEAVAAAHRLIASADAVIVNFRPSTLATYRFDYETLSKENPRLVYAALSGFGPSGPYSEFPAYDMVIQGMTGFMPTQGGGGNPAPVRAAVVDKIVAYSAVITILAALLHRKNGGKGQKIDISMMDAYAAFMLPETFYTRSFLDAPELAHWTTNIYNPFRVSDGWVIGFLMTDRHFENACAAFGLEQFRHDSRFADAAQRNLFQPELMATIGKACAHMTVAEFVAIARGNELPFAPINNIEQFMADPQTIHNETFVEFDHPGLGRIKLLNSFARLSETPVNARSLPPEVGEHTAAVLGSIGLSDAQIRRLKAPAAGG